MTAGVEVYLCMNEISENSNLKLWGETSSTEKTSTQAVHDEVNYAQLTSTGYEVLFCSSLQNELVFKKEQKDYLKKKKKMFFKWSLLLSFPLQIILLVPGGLTGVHLYSAA